MERLRIKKRSLYSDERAIECLDKDLVRLVLKLCRRELTARCRLNGFLSRFSIYFIAFDNDFAQFWNFNLYTR